MNDTKSSWLSKYNFPSLLNLVDVLQEFGSLKNLWEGGYQGEGYLQFTKPLLKQGVRKNWQSNTLKKLLELTALEVITNKTCPEVKEYEEASCQISSAYVYIGVGMVN